MTVNLKDDYNKRKYKVEFEMYGRCASDVKELILLALEKEGKSDRVWTMKEHPKIKVEII